MSLLETKKIHSGYGNIEILHGIDLHLDDGEIVAIIGPNGSGKSTFLKTICGFLKPRKGQIIFDGKDITALPSHMIFKTGIAYIAQWRSIFPEMTVIENMEMGGYVIKDKKILNERIEKSFELFPHLEGKKDMNANLLSGGEQRMLELARAMVVNSKCLLVDEPTIALAPIFVELIFKKLVEISKKQGMSILIVEQNARKALSIAHRGYVFDMGKKKFEDKSNKILKNPKVVKLYLGI